MAQTSKRENETRSMPPVSPVKLAIQKENGAVLTEKDTIPVKRNVSAASKSANLPAGASSARGASQRRKNISRPTPSFGGKANFIKNNPSARTGSGAYSKIKRPAATGGGAAVIKKPRRVKFTVKERERFSKFDFPFFTIVIVLLAFGIVMMFSASYAIAYRETGNSYFYVSRQLVFITVGITAMLFLSVIDYHILLNKFIMRVAATVSAGLMLMVKMGGGVTQGGAERWIEIGGFTVQPSEILKFAVIIIFAYITHEKYSKLRDFKQGFVPMMVCLCVACGLTLIQPHLSGTIIIFLIGIVMMFVGDCSVKHILLMVLTFAVLAVLGLALLNAMGYDYFGDRILSWRDPEAEIQGATFQTYQSLVTIGSGGIFGLGLGNSRQKYSYLPVSHNDFVFSIICEELGFVGAILVILLFIIFVFRGFYIASRARDKFGMMLAVGITSQLGIQALLNIGVVTNSIPNTGISLPFFSYGGSAIMMQLAEIGVLLNISRKAAIE